MSARLVLLLVVLAAFSVLTAKALIDVGYVGIITSHFENFGGMQVIADLVIACLLACVWMVADGRTSGVNPWPFVAVTLVAGSFGPLLYLVVRGVRASRRMPAAA